METQTLSFNTVVMSNAATTVIVTLALYLALSSCAQSATRWWLARHQMRLPARFFAPARFRYMRDAWGDGAIACFGLAALSAVGHMSMLITVLGLLGALGALVVRTLGDSALAGASTIRLE